MKAPRPLMLMACLLFLNLTAAGVVLPVATAPGAIAQDGSRFFNRPDLRELLPPAPDEVQEPLTISGDARRPLIYFRSVANRRWPVGAIFFFTLLMSAALKIFLPALTEATVRRIRSSFFAGLASTFVYSTLLVLIVRFGFHNEDLSAMGMFTFGLLQFSFAIGAALGANVFAEIFYQRLSGGKTINSSAVRAGLYGLCLLLTATMMALISLIPQIGPLPRLGNRIVMLIAALGLGGLVNLAASRARKPGS